MNVIIKIATRLSLDTLVYKTVLRPCETRNIAYLNSEVCGVFRISPISFNLLNKLKTNQNNFLKLENHVISKDTLKSVVAH